MNQDRTKIEIYTEKFLKFMRARAWLKRQEEDFNNKAPNMGPEKYKKAKVWLDKQCQEFLDKVCEPLDAFWQDFMTQEERDQWMFENENMLNNE